MKLAAGGIGSEKRGINARTNESVAQTIAE
jgi:hypothetical protein